MFKLVREWLTVAAAMMPVFVHMAQESARFIKYNHNSKKKSLHAENRNKNRRQ